MAFVEPFVSETPHSANRLQRQKFDGQWSVRVLADSELSSCSRDLALEDVRHR